LVMKHSFAFILILALSSSALAGNFTVSNVTQFQNALNTCSSNSQHDTINVMAGTYSVNPTLTYSTTQNYFLLIRGSGSPVFEGGNSRQILRLEATTGSAGISIEGLIFQHGRADYGGGLNVATIGGDIRLSNCTFNDNTAGFVCGGANLFSNTGDIFVTNCTFRRNSSPNTSGYPYGTAGGLFIQTDGAGTVIKLTGSTFEFNTAERDAAGAMLYPLSSGSTVIAEYNTFNNNTAKEFGGGCWIRGPGGNTNVTYRNNFLSGNSSSTAGSGGGTYIQIASGSINLFDNIHNGNDAAWQGGGLWIEHGGGTLNCHRNRFINNTTDQTGGGANIFLDNGILNLNHNIFKRNYAAGSGGGLNASTTTGTLNIFNNTFHSNSSPDGGDVYIYFDSPSSSSNFYNNILYSSSPPALSYSGQQTVTARYSDIKGGIGQPWFGTGCIDTYPFFVDTSGNNFHLQDSINCSNPRYSPCIDKGNPAIQDSIHGCDWGLGQVRSDMGAYGGKDTIPIGIKKVYEKIPEQYNLRQNYPNPFNPSTKIFFSIPLQRGVSEGRSVLARIVIYDILGREITTLINEKLGPGTYEVNWDSSNYPSGVYFYSLITSDYTETKKMVLLK
jgi:hypothetical protein